MLKSERAQKTRREANKAAKLAAIEAAGRRLFAERGYAATTTRAIANAAEVGAGTFFVYFPEKLDLLVHLYRRDLERVTEEALDALSPGAPLVEQAMDVFTAIFRLYERDPDLARVFVKELLFLSPERQGAVFAMTLAFLSRVADLVREAQARGEVRAGELPVAVAHQLFGTYYFTLVTWLTSGLVGPEQRDLMLRDQLGRLFAGLRPAPAEALE